LTSASSPRCDLFSPRRRHRLEHRHWIAGIPSSSSHALIGGLVGAGVAKAGSAHRLDRTCKTVAAIVLSPASGFLLALVLIVVVSWLFVRQTPFAVDSTFRVLQFFSASLYSLGHGGNDAQKTMGIIAVLLYSQGMLGEKFYVPLWVVLTCQTALALGTLFGGWRIVHTMGSKITRLNPMQVSAPRPVARSPYLLPPGSASPSRRPTRSPAPSSASAPPVASQPCAGHCRQHRRRLDRHLAGHGRDFRTHLPRHWPGKVMRLGCA